MSCNCNDSIYRGDDSNAFGQQLLVLEANIPEGWEISRVEIKIGDLPVIIVNNPEFPLPIDLTADQTILLKDTNKIYVACYDQYGRKKTCKGFLPLNTTPKKV